MIEPKLQYKYIEKMKGMVEMEKKKASASSFIVERWKVNQKYLKLKNSESGNTNMLLIDMEVNTNELAVCLVLWKKWGRQTEFCW